MDALNWSQILIQIPLVAAFIWYSLETQKRYQDSMEKRDVAYLTALEKISAKLDKHDDQAREILTEVKRK